MLASASSARSNINLFLPIPRIVETFCFWYFGTWGWKSRGEDKLLGSIHPAGTPRMPTYILSCCRKQCCLGLPKANMPFLKFQLFLPQFAFHPFPSWTTLESFPGRASVTTWLLSIWVNTVWVARRSPRPPHRPPRRPPPCSSCPLTSRPPPVFLHLSQHRLSGLSLFFSLKISICFTYFSTLLKKTKSLIPFNTLLFRSRLSWVFLSQKSFAQITQFADFVQPTVPQKLDP